MIHLVSPLSVLRFRLERGDIDAVERWQRAFPLWIGLVCGVVAGGLFAVFETELAPLTRAFAGAEQVATIVLAAVAWYVVSLLLREVQVRGRVRRAALPASETVVTFFDDRLEIEADGSRRAHGWGEVLAVARRGDHALVTFADDRLILPLRAFADGDQMVRMVAEIDARAHGATD